MRKALGSWKLTDLERRLCNILDVARRAVEQLAPAGYADPNEPSEALRPEKVVAETAFLLLAASRLEAPEVARRVGETARCLIPHARNDRMLLGLCLQPGLALDFATAHICLDRIGYRDTHFDAVLRKTLASQASKGQERVPYRILEQEWLLRGLNLTSPVSASKLCVLSQPMDLLTGNRDDFYAFTHSLLYLRDFNISPLPLPRGRRTLLAEAEAGLAWCLAGQDYDLGGELLLSWPLTGYSWSPISTFAFRVLAHVEDEAGFLPAPNTSLKKADQLSGDERAKYLLASAYHTVYVMGLLAALCLQDGRTPPERIDSKRAVPGAAAEVLRIVNVCEPESHWRAEFAGLTSTEQDALAGMLLAMALRQKAQERDFRTLSVLLATGWALGLTDSPIASQSAELLERLAAFAPASGAATAA